MKPLQPVTNLEKVIRALSFQAMNIQESLVITIKFKNPC
jgi:hypothetical protein